ncbi:MAG: hypothetical protein B1H09_06200 [Gemmatimonadaceae bacterium 4484_173]|nr:MAG: hypothetical protein B1H09_06200 [Gemmatimonadaceae bacterium 4484_173]RKZ04967.1 MAG: hypothetical protein DRQ21_01145 [Candidatus Fermentibacteria bacterium]
MQMKIEVSVGELVDKVSILEIKLEKILNPEKLANVKIEYNLLLESMKLLDLSNHSDIFLELKKINLCIWETEDRIRKLEAEKRFDAEFITHARNVYFDNDRRAALKKQINTRYNSRVVEEKQYTDYRQKLK